MNRRNFIGLTAAALAAPQLAWATDDVVLDYVPGLLEERLANGETVLLDYAADWCSTCRRQERIISQLRADNPELNDHITFIRVDWDQYGSDEVSTSRRIPRRSTLVLLRGDQELGRIVAGTRPADIKALLDLGIPKV